MDLLSTAPRPRLEVERRLEEKAELFCMLQQSRDDLAVSIRCGVYTAKDVLNQSTLQADESHEHGLLSAWL